MLVDEAVSNDGVHLNYERRECVWSYGCNILNSKRESVKNGLEDLEKLGGSIDPKKKYIVHMAISNGRRSSTIREWIPKTAWTKLLISSAYLYLRESYVMYAEKSTVAKDRGVISDIKFKASARFLTKEQREHLGIPDVIVLSTDAIDSIGRMKN